MPWQTVLDTGRVEILKYAMIFFTLAYDTQVE